MAPKRRRSSEDDRVAGPEAAAGPSGRIRATATQPVHRYAFVQHLMKRGYIMEERAKVAFQRLTGSRDDDAYRRMVADQNREMACLDLQIRTLKYPVDDERYVGFVNTHADEPSKLGTRYTPQEREFFRMALETIALDDRANEGVGSASSIQLLNAEVRPQTQATQQQRGDADGEQRLELAKMTKVAKEATLRRLVADGWLKHGLGGGVYCLGVRAFLELGPQLLELPDLPEDTKAAWQDLM